MEPVKNFKLEFEMESDYSDIEDVEEYFKKTAPFVDYESIVPLDRVDRFMWRLKRSFRTGKPLNKRDSASIYFLWSQRLRLYSYIWITLHFVLLGLLLHLLCFNPARGLQDFLLGCDMSFYQQISAVFMILIGIFLVVVDVLTRPSCMDYLEFCANILRVLVGTCLLLKSLNLIVEIHVFFQYTTLVLFGLTAYSFVLPFSISILPLFGHSIVHHIHIVLHQYTKFFVPLHLYYIPFVWNHTEIVQIIGQGIYLSLGIILFWILMMISLVDIALAQKDAEKNNHLGRVYFYYLALQPVLRTMKKVEFLSFK